MSNDGNGGFILTTPDPPINLVNLPLVTSSSQIGLQWEDGDSDGGSTVIDYRVLTNGGSGNTFTALESNVLTSTYTATS